MANDVLIFDNAVQTTNVNDFPATTQFNGLTFAFDAGAFTATGAEIKLEGGISNQSINDQDFSGINFHMQDGNRIIDTGAQTLSMGTIRAGSPVKPHTKIGSGILHLTSDNVGSGDYTRFTVDAGTLLLDANTTENRQTVESVTINPADRRVSSRSAAVFLCVASPITS